MVLAAGEILGRGTLEYNVGQMAIVDTMVPTERPNLMVIKLMLHFKTYREKSPRILIRKPDREGP